MTESLPGGAVSDSAATPAAPVVRPMGAHMPTAGGLHKSITSGHEIGCTAVQLFTSSPRQWSHSPLDPAAIATFHAAREASDVVFTVAHDSYLINLAAPAAEVLERSRSAFRGELDRAEALGIPWVVTHMGAHLNTGLDEAIARLVDSLKRILEETDKLGYRAGIALETTAGQGTGLGWQFSEIGAVLSGVGAHPRLGVCLDTCHIFVAGYDLRDDESYAKTWEEFESTIGRANLKVIHANDAKKGLGSRVDRHEHIGAGEIGAAGFGRLMMDPALAHVPVIIETPDSDTMHGLNLARLQRLSRGSSLDLAIDVQLFGHYSDVAAGAPLTISVPYGATVRDLTLLLAATDARLAPIADHCRFAVGEDYASLEAVLKEDCTVAVLPPMSGG